MAYDIRKLSSIDPASFPFYFFDANVWIAQLRSVNGLAEGNDAAYCDFFEAVVSLNLIDQPKALKKITHQPKIIVTPLLLSEIFNAYMRSVAMRIHYYDEGKKSGLNNDAAASNFKMYDFKKHYRITQHFKDQLKKLKSDFISFKVVIEFRNDAFMEAEPLSLIRDISDEADFNDFLYYYTLVDLNIPIVTTDNDFCFQDITILTENRKLLNVNKA